MTGAFAAVMIGEVVMNLAQSNPIGHAGSDTHHHTR
jgi:hypothetical protein